MHIHARIARRPAHRPAERFIFPFLIIRIFLIPGHGCGQRPVRLPGGRSAVLSLPFLRLEREGARDLRRGLDSVLFLAFIAQGRRCLPYLR